VRMRVGLDDGRAKTAKELAAVFELPAYAILKEERIALTKLRVAPATQRLRGYAELLDALS
jgi:DNA-directed RNA polymerase sigma subunit (sigma70/sigma32)